MWLKLCWAAWLTVGTHVSLVSRAQISFPLEADTLFLAAGNCLTLFLVQLNYVLGCSKGQLLPKGRWDRN